MHSQHGRESEQNALEKALPELLGKLSQFRTSLGSEERVVLDEIILSAAHHTEFVNADDIRAHGDKLYMKPMSVHVTAQMREEMLRMPERFGIDTGDWRPGEAQRRGST